MSSAPRRPTSGSGERMSSSFIIGAALVVAVVLGCGAFFALRLLVRPLSLSEPSPRASDTVPASHPAGVPDALADDAADHATADGGLRDEPQPSDEALAEAARELDALKPDPPPADAGPPSPAPVARTGTLQIALERGWADVLVDGKDLGRIPEKTRFTLAAGRHTLELRNPHAAPYRVEIEIRSGRTLVHRAVLEAP